MSRILVLFLTLASAATLYGQAARMRFESMDTNGDGVITRTEWRGSPRTFENNDWNGDGRLSGDEVAIGRQRGTNWEQADHAPNRYERYANWTQAGFNNLDHNRDRAITPNEWHFDRETFRRVDRDRDGALQLSEFLGSGADDLRGDNFDDIDMNNNGRVERNEWSRRPRCLQQPRSEPGRRAEPFRGRGKPGHDGRDVGRIRLARL